MQKKKNKKQPILFSVQLHVSFSLALNLPLWICARCTAQEFFVDCAFRTVKGLEISLEKYVLNESSSTVREWVILFFFFWEFLRILLRVNSSLVSHLSHVGRSGWIRDRYDGSLHLALCSQCCSLGWEEVTAQRWAKLHTLSGTGCKHFDAALLVLLLQLLLFSVGPGMQKKMKTLASICLIFFPLGSEYLSWWLKCTQEGFSKELTSWCWHSGLALGNHTLEEQQHGDLGAGECLFVQHASSGLCG